MNDSFSPREILLLQNLTRAFHLFQLLLKSIALSLFCLSLKYRKYSQKDKSSPPSLQHQELKPVLHSKTEPLRGILLNIYSKHMQAKARLQSHLVFRVKSKSNLLTHVHTGAMLFSCSPSPPFFQHPTEESRWSAPH